MPDEENTPEQPSTAGPRKRKPRPNAAVDKTISPPTEPSLVPNGAEQGVVEQTVGKRSWLSNLGLMSTLVTIGLFLGAWVLVELLAEPGTQISLPMGITYVKGDGFTRLRDSLGPPAGTRHPVLIGSDIDANTPPGTYFRDCNHCPLMVVVPAGSFLMGASRGDGLAEPDEGPVRRVQVPRSFAIAVFETTFVEWDAGVGAGKLPRAQNPYDGVTADFGWGRGKRPVINVTWDESLIYIRWLNETLGGELYRLPSEAEWEYAARGGAETAYTFGRDYRTDLVADGNEKTETVGSYPANRFGLFDVQGNVWEWTADCWHDDFTNAPLTSDIWTEGGDCQRHAIRGGSWGREAAQMRLSNRVPSSSKGYRLGFRVVRDILPLEDTLRAQ